LFSSEQIWLNYECLGTYLAVPIEPLPGVRGRPRPLPGLKGPAGRSAATPCGICQHILVGRPPFGRPSAARSDPKVCSHPACNMHSFIHFICRVTHALGRLDPGGLGNFWEDRPPAMTSICVNCARKTLPETGRLMERKFFQSIRMPLVESQALSATNY